jgi:methyltransferase family protein
VNSESGEIVDLFHSEQYRQINARRLEHLAALHLPLFDRTVLQVGAGIGDLAGFFVDRGCTVTLTEGRHENLDVLRALYPDLAAFRLDLDLPDAVFAERFDVVHCYGTLYHLARPAEAIAYMAERCEEMLLVETCVSVGTEPLLAHVTEASEPDQALGGIGSRPTRSWVYHHLSRYFEFVYLPTVQPAHPQFPTDWTREPMTALTRAVFVASRRQLDNPLLTTSLPDRQARA